MCCSGRSLHEYVNNNTIEKLYNDVNSNGSSGTLSLEIVRRQSWGYEFVSFKFTKDDLPLGLVLEPRYLQLSSEIGEWCGVV